MRLNERLRKAMMEQSCGIDSVPVVDFSAYSSEKSEPDQECLQKLVDEIHDAFTTIGFVYLKNTGCPQQVVDFAFQKSLAFFHLKKEEKLKYRRGDIVPKTDFGYIEVEQEGLNPDRPHKDLKEAFNFVPLVAEETAAELIRTPEVVEMIDALKVLHDKGTEVMMRVLEVMARGLKLKDPQFFVKRHQNMHKTGPLRTLHYPALRAEDIKDEQIRCGEHSDYGCITLLFQDDKGGLEVRNIDGKWIKALPIEGTILVNLGDLMQRWTADKLIATKHRVMPPPSDTNDNTAGRQSMALFGDTDHEEIIECLDGSNKYPPIGSLEYLNLRFSVTYK